MMKKLSITLFAVILIVLILPVAALALEEAASPRVTTVRGSVSVLRSGGMERSAAFRGMELDGGDMIITGPNASATIIFEHKEMMIAENTTLAIHEIWSRRERVLSSITLVEGMVKKRVDIQLNNNSSNIIRTSNTVSGVRGTEYILIYSRMGFEDFGEENPFTRIKVLEGEVRFDLSGIDDIRNFLVSGDGALLLDENIRGDLALTDPVHNPQNVSVPLSDLDSAFLEALLNDPRVSDFHNSINTVLDERANRPPAQVPAKPDPRDGMITVSEAPDILPTLPVPPPEDLSTPPAPQPSASTTIQEEPVSPETLPTASPQPSPSIAPPVPTQPSPAPSPSPSPSPSPFPVIQPSPSPEPQPSEAPSGGGSNPSAPRNQAPFSINPVQAPVYGDAPFNLTVTGGSGSGAVTFTLTSGDAVSVAPDSGMVTIEKAGTAVITATKAGSSGFNPISASITIEVGRRDISNVTINVTGSHIYNGEEQTPEITVTDGTNNLITISDYSVGYTGDRINIGTVTITLSGQGNYFGETTQDFIIESRELIIAFTAHDKEYDGNTAALINEISIDSGLITGDIVIVSGGSAVFYDKTAAINKTVTASGFTLSGSDAFNYTIASVNEAKAAITPRPLTISGITADTRYYDATDNIILAGGILHNIVDDDDVDFTLNGGQTADAAAGDAKPVNPNTVTLAGEDAANYSLTQPSGITVDIKPLPVTVTPDTGQGKTRHEPDPDQFSFTANPELYHDDEFSGKLERATGEEYGDYLFNLGNLSAGPNYTLTLGGSVSFNIDKANPLVTWPDNITATFNDTLSDIIITGGTHSVAGQFSWTEPGSTSVGNAGLREHNMTFTPDDSDNYNILTSYVNIDVKKAAQANINILSPGPKTYGDNAFTLVATGGTTGLNPTFELVSGTALSVTPGGFTTIDNAGAAVVKATMAGDDNYHDISTEITISVARRDITNVTINITSIHTYDGEEQTPEFTVTDGMTNNLITIDDYSISYSPDRTNAVTVTFTLTGQANYSGTISQDFIINRRELTIGFTAEDKEYDGNTTAVIEDVFFSSGFIPGDDVNILGGVAQFDNPSVRNEKTVAATDFTLDGIHAGNYIIKEINDTKADIMQRTLTISGVTANNRNYDTTDIIILSGGTLHNFVTNEDVNFILNGGWVSDANAEDNKTVNPNPITLIGDDAANYTLTPPDGIKVNITPLPVTITPDLGQSKIRHEADPEFSFTAAPELFTGDDFTGALSRMGGEGAETYAFTIGNLSAGGNYALTLGGNVSFEIHKATPLVTWPSGITATYGDTLAIVATVGGSATLPHNTTNLPGSFVWTEDLSTSVGNAGVRTHNMTFIPADDANYNLVAQDISITVEKAGQAGLTGTEPVIKTYGDASFLLDITGGSGEGTFTYSLKEGNAVKVAADTGMVTIERSGEATVTVTKAGDDNFNVISTDINITINKRDITLVDIGSLGPYTYTGKDHIPVPNVTDIVGGSNLINTSDYELTYLNNKNVGTTATVTVTARSDGNYSGQKSASFEIVRKELMVQVENEAIEFNEEAPLFTYEITGYVDGEDRTNLSGDPAISTAYIRGAPVGNYEIVIEAGTLKADNYSFTFVNGTLSVGLARQNELSITDPGAKTYGDVPFTLSTSGGSGSGTLSFISSNSDILMVDGDGNATIKNAGTVTVTVIKAADDEYQSTQAAREIIITKKLITELDIVVNNVTFNGQTQSPVVTIMHGMNTLSPGVDYELINTPSEINAGNYDFEIRGIGNYTGISQQVFTVGKAALNLLLTAERWPDYQFGDGPAHLNLSGNSGSGDVTYESSAPQFVSVSSSGLLTFVGAGEAKITATVKETANYQGDVIDIDINVAKRPFTYVNIGGIDNVIYNGTNQTPVPSIIDLTLGSVTSEDYDIAYSTNRRDVGEVTVTITPKRNYEGLAVIRTFKITQAPLSLTVTPPSEQRTLTPLNGENSVNYEVTVNGLLASDIITVTGGVTGSGSGTVLTFANNVGISASQNTRTIQLSYTGTEVPDGYFETNLVIAGNPNYELSVSPEIKIYITDGLAVTRQIPVNENNIETFNTFAANLGLRRHYILSEDVMLSDTYNWTAIGRDNDRFTGSFDGNGKTISGLIINSNEGHQGMFGVIGAGGAVRNLGLPEVNINDTSTAGTLGRVGGIAGLNFGTIENCFVTGKVQSSSTRVGGIVGGNSRTVRNCFFIGEVRATGFAGGIAGANTGVSNNNAILENSYSAGSVNSASNEGEGNGAGGVAGYNFHGIIRNCVAINQSVSHARPDTVRLGRITGRSHDGSSHNNNRSWIGMTLNGDITTGGTINGYNGLPIPAATLKTKAVWDNATFSFGGTEAHPWVWDDDDGYMPRLWFAPVAPEMSWPDYLKDDISNANINVTSTLIYNGEEQEPEEFTVTLNGLTLVEGRDFTAAFSNNKNAGDEARITITGMGDNYTGIATQDFTINKKSLTVTTEPKTVTFGAPVPNADAFTVIYDGFVGGQTAANLGGDLVITTDYTSTSPVSDSPYTITPSGLTSNNYAISFETGRLTVNPRPISGAIVAVPNTEFTYDGTEHKPTNMQVTVTLAGVLLTPDDDFDVTHYANNTDAAPGPATVTITAKGNYTGTANGTFAIGQKPITAAFTTDNKVYDGNTTAAVLTRTLIGVLPADSEVTLTGGSASFDNKNAGDGKTVTFTGFVLSGNRSANYRLINDYATATAAIYKKEVSLSGLSAANKEYDGNTTATVIGTAVIEGNIDGGNLTVADTGSAEFDDKNVGNNKPVTFSGYSLTGTAAGNYNLLQPASVNADITQKPLSWNASTPGTVHKKTYDRSTDAKVATAPGLSGVLTINTVPDDVTVTPGTVTFENKDVGTHEVTASGTWGITGADAGNYSISELPLPTFNDAEITPKQLTWDASTPGTVEPKTFDGTLSATIATAPGLSGVIEPDKVTVDSANATATFVSANVGSNGVGVTASGSGTWGISGDDAGNYLVPGDNPPFSNGTINRANLTVATQPKTSEIIIWNRLYTSSFIENGIVTGVGGAPITGTWVWSNPNLQMDSTGPREVNAIFTPTNSPDNGNYHPKTEQLIVTVLDVPGSLDNPFLVGTEEQLRMVGRGDENPTAYHDWDRFAYYKLTDDIELKQGNWTPIGTTTARFRGGLNGDGHTISNMRIESTSGEPVGMFTEIEGSNVITNLGLVDVNISGSSHTGGLAGVASLGATTNSNFVTGDISGGGHTGGLIGFVSHGVIRNSYFTGSVSGSGNNVGVGGLAGKIYTPNDWGVVSEIIAGYSEATVTSTGIGAHVGGIVGWAQGQNIGSRRVTLEACYSTGNVTGFNAGAGAVGGIVGLMEHTHLYSTYATGSIVSRASSNPGTGGLVGSVSGDHIRVRFNAAVNRGIHAFSGGDKVARVIGTNDAGLGSIVDNNHALESLRVTVAGVSQTPTPDANQKDGANISKGVLTATVPAEVVFIEGGSRQYWSFENNEFLPRLFGMPGRSYVIPGGVGRQEPRVPEQVSDPPVWPIGDAVVTIPDVPFIFSGAEHKPTPTVKLNGVTLVQDTHFTVDYEDNTNAGTAKVIINVKDNKYSGTVLPVNFTITPRPLTEATEIVTGSLTYNNTLLMPNPITVTLDGRTLIPGTDFTVTDHGNNINAGVNTATVTITGINNYSGTATGNFTITPAPLTWNPGTVQPKNYDGLTNATVIIAPTLNGVIGSDDVTVTVGTAAFSSANVGTHTVTGNDWGVGGTGLGNYTAPTAQPTFANAAINPVQLTWNNNGRVDDKTYNRSANASVHTRPTLNGVLDGDTVTVTDGSVAFDNMNVGTNKPITATGWGISGTHAGNYSISGQPTFASAAINPVQLNWNNNGRVDDKTYNRSANASVHTRPTLNGVLDGDTVTVTDGSVAFDNMNVGTNKPITATGWGISGTHAGNYSITGQPTFANAAINRRQLSWNAPGTVSNRAFNGNNTATVANAPGLGNVVSGDTVTVTNGTVTFASANVGTHAINVSGTWGIDIVSAVNYIVPGGQPTFNNGTINRATLTADNVTTPPTASDILTGQPLNQSTLSGGSVTGVCGTDIPGTWTWETPDAILSAGTHTRNAVFAHTNTNHVITPPLSHPVSVSVAMPDGSPERPFLITNETELRAVGRGDANPDGYKNWTLDANYRLVDNITLTQGNDWQPIGVRNPFVSGQVTPFTGGFDGGGRTITGLTINNTLEDNQGMFDTVDGAQISNLTLVEVNISARDNVGGLVGTTQGATVISNVHVDGAINGRGTIGGLVGNNSGTTIKNSSAKGKVTVTVTGIGDGVTVSNIGGLVGRNSGPIKQGSADVGVTVTIDVNINDQWSTLTLRDIGGLVGQNSGASIESSSATGDVTVTATATNRTFNLEHVGGLVGRNSAAEIESSSATGDVTGTINGVSGSHVGGLIGRAEGGSEIKNSFATGKVTGINNSIIDSWRRFDNVGGLVGYNIGTILNSRAIGDVTTVGSLVGGLVGYHAIGTILNSHATGNVTTSSERGSVVGGLAGRNEANGIIQYCYATGNVTVTDNTPVDRDRINQIGGLVGNNAGGSRVFDAFATGNVSLHVSYRDDRFQIGGLVGTNQGSSSIIQRTFASGTVTTSQWGGGGLAGLSWSARLTNSVALNTTLTASGASEAGEAGRRVTSQLDGGTVNTNYARDDMLVRWGLNNNQVNPASDIGHNSRGGESITATHWEDPEWWRGTAFGGINGSGGLTQEAWDWWKDHLPPGGGGGRGAGMMMSMMALETAEITVTAEAGGQVSIDGGETWHSEITEEFIIGMDLTVTAMPDDGYAFTHWLNEDGEPLGEEDEYTFTVEEDTELTAVFAEDNTPAASPEELPCSCGVDDCDYEPCDCGEDDCDCTPDDEPDENHGDEPSNDYGIEPSDDAGGEPDDNHGNQPDDENGDEPEDNHSNQPGDGHDGQPDDNHGNQPDDGHGNQPNDNHDIYPDDGHGNHPDDSHNSQPNDDHSNQQNDNHGGNDNFHATADDLRNDNLSENVKDTSEDDFFLLTVHAHSPGSPSFTQSERRDGFDMRILGAVAVAILLLKNLPHMKLRRRRRRRR